MVYIHHKRLVGDQRTGKIRSEFDQVQLQIPPGKNPFEFILNYILEKTTSYLPTSTRITLEAFFTFHIVISACCLFILLLPFLRAKRERIWIIKKLYITDPSGEKVNPRPLYLLNSGVVMAFLQLLGSVSAQIYIWVLIHIFQDGGSSSKTLLLLLCVTYEFEFITYWVMAWGFLCTWLYSETSYAAQLKMNPRRTISPAIYNSIFLAFPILTFCMSAIIIYRLDVTSEKEGRLWKEMSEELLSLSETWKTLQSSKDNSKMPSLLGKLQEGGMNLKLIHQDFMLSLIDIISAYRLLCATWTPVMFITSMAFIYALWNLLSFSLKKPDQSNRILARETPGYSPQSQSNILRNLTLRSPNSKAEKNLVMKRSIYHLAFRGAMAFLAIFSTIVFCMMGAIRAEMAILNKSWRLSMFWFSLVSGASSAVPITFQCWRMYCDKGELPNGSLAKTSKNEKPSGSSGSETLVAEPDARELEEVTVHISLPRTNSSSISK